MPAFARGQGYLVRRGVIGGRAGMFACTVLLAARVLSQSVLHAEDCLSERVCTQSVCSGFTFCGSGFSYHVGFAWLYTLMGVTRPLLC